MTTVTLTPLTGLAAVRIEVAAAPSGALTITRTDTNGVGTVRLLPGQEPSAGSLVVIDYEAALTGTLTYEVLDSAATLVTATTELGVAFPWITGAAMPQYRQQVTAVTEYREQSATRGIVHQIIDGPDVVTPTRLGLRTGSLTAWCPSYADATHLREVAREGEVVMFRQPDHPGMDMYAVFESVDVAPRTDPTATVRWTVGFAFREQSAPDSPLMGAAGWTCQDVEDTYATCADVLTTYLTCRDLEVGP